MELYNAQKMPLSNNPELKAVQEKILNGESITVMEKIIAGRDHPIKELFGYKLKPDHCYRAINESTYKRYLENGFIIGEGPNDEYQEYVEDGKTFNNNKGVDWYLGGVAVKYGDIILECPADKKYFEPAYDNGTHMAYDPNVRLLKSSGAKNPVPMAMVTNVFNLKKKNIQNENQGFKDAETEVNDRSR